MQEVIARLPDENMDILVRQKESTQFTNADIGAWCASCDLLGRNSRRSNKRNTKRNNDDGELIFTFTRGGVRTMICSTVGHVCLELNEFNIKSIMIYLECDLKTIIEIQLQT